MLCTMGIDTENDAVPTVYLVQQLGGEVKLDLTENEFERLKQAGGTFTPYRDGLKFIT